MFKATRLESDLDALREERQANALPWSQSPFACDARLVNSDPDNELELRPGELIVKAPEEVPWIDLLLEIAMTTAFASLTDGTPILEIEDALSYVAYFAFVWWIWVAQVAYNVRFRQADVLHKIWVLAQLIVFSALAAFTRDFNITTGTFQSADAALVDELLAQAGEGRNGLAASHFRLDNRLPLLNARGLSVTMALSRLLLLLQYVVVFYHARGLTRTSLVAHIVPLLFSSLAYFTAFIILGDRDGDTGAFTSGPSHGVEIAKLLLWYVPIFMEIISHFVALSLPGFVKYSTELVYERSGTVFLIILGAGLDKITTGFQTIVGNAGLGRDGIPIFISAAVIFIGFFSLYFGTPGSKRKLGSGRVLAWFFSQFIFLAFLIVALQGIAMSLSFSNLNAALRRGNGAIKPVYDWMNSNPHVNVTATDFGSEYLFESLGSAFSDFVDDMNTFTTLGIQLNDSTIVPTGQLFEEMSLYNTILDIFGAIPNPNSLLYAKLNVFLHTKAGNTTVLNLANFEDLYSSIIKDRASAGLWFYPAAGSVILALVLTSLIKGLPRDKWEWIVLTSRFLIGGIVCSLALLDIGSSKPVFDSDGNLTDSKIWSIIVGPSHLLLIIMAIMMIILLIIQNLIAYAAIRNTKLGPKYQRMDADDVLPLKPYHHSGQGRSEYAHPYDPYHRPENTLQSWGRC